MLTGPQLDQLITQLRSTPSPLSEEQVASRVGWNKESLTINK